MSNLNKNNMWVNANAVNADEKPLEAELNMNVNSQEGGQEEIVVGPQFNVDGEVADVGPIQMIETPVNNLYMDLLHSVQFTNTESASQFQAQSQAQTQAQSQSQLVDGKDNSKIYNIYFSGQLIHNNNNNVDNRNNIEPMSPPDSNYNNNVNLAEHGSALNADNSHYNQYTGDETAFLHNSLNEQSSISAMNATNHTLCNTLINTVQAQNTHTVCNIPIDALTGLPVNQTGGQIFYAHSMNVHALQQLNSGQPSVYYGKSSDANMAGQQVFCQPVFYQAYHPMTGQPFYTLNVGACNTYYQNILPNANQPIGSINSEQNAYYNDPNKILLNPESISAVNTAAMHSADQQEYFNLSTGFFSVPSAVPEFQPQPTVQTINPVQIDNASNENQTDVAYEFNKICYSLEQMQAIGDSMRSETASKVWEQQEEELVKTLCALGIYNCKSTTHSSPPKPYAKYCKQWRATK